MPEGWSDFLVAEVGASAALGGLLFVGLSINLEQILALPGIPNRAFTALAMLLTVLVVCSLGLVPHQSGTSIGIETLVIGGILWIAGTRGDIREYRGRFYYTMGVFLGDVILFQIAVLPYLIGSVLILSGYEGGFFFIAAAVVISFVKAVLDAWVLLVEIKR